MGVQKEVISPVFPGAGAEVQHPRQATCKDEVPVTRRRHKGQQTGKVAQGHRETDAMNMEQVQHEKVQGPTIWLDTHLNKEVAAWLQLDKGWEGVLECRTRVGTRAGKEKSTDENSCAARASWQLSSLEVFVCRRFSGWLRALAVPAALLLMCSSGNPPPQFLMSDFMNQTLGRFPITRTSGSLFQRGKLRIPDLIFLPQRGKADVLFCYIRKTLLA